MWKLIQILIYGHVHKWKIIQKIRVIDLDRHVDIPIGRSYILQCEHCGNIKRINTRAD